MPRYEGTVKRARPRVNVMRGYTGNEPQSLSRSAPVASGVTIKSGQAIALNGAEEWDLATHTDPVVYIAYHDSDDTDVKSCGKLLGFSSLGSYELETAYTTAAGLAAATGPDLGVEVSNATAGSLTITGAGDSANTVVLGRTSTAAVDLSTGGLGGYSPLGEDDSSDAWGSSGAATGGNVTHTFTGLASSGVDVTLTIGGTDYTVPTVAFNTNQNTTVADIKTAIDTLVLATQDLDAAIKTVAVATNVITITTHDGTANNVTVSAVSDDGIDTITVTEGGTQGTEASATTSKNVLRWVTTAS